MLFFRPTQKQSELLNHPETARFLVVLGANKIGKTWLGINWDLGNSYGYRYWEVPDLKLDPRTGDLPAREEIPPRYWIRHSNGIPIQVPNTGMVVTGLPRERGIGQIIWPCYEHFVPPSVQKNWKVTKGPQGVATHLRLPNGSEVIFSTADQDPLSFEGTRIQWAHCDEPVKPFVFNGLCRGLMIDNGSILFTLTPLGVDAAWMNMRFCNPASDLVMQGLVHLVRAKISDNPYLTREHWEQFAASGEWTDAERKARLEGEFESLGNRLIHTFDPSVHVIPAFSLPRDWIRGMTVDPHHSRAPAIAWWRKSPDGIYHFYREWPDDLITKTKRRAMPPTELAIFLRNIEADQPAQVRIADPRFGKAKFTSHGKQQAAWVDLMGEQGLKFDARIPDIATIEIGETKLCDMFRWDSTFPISPTNTPKIFIHDTCPNLIASLNNYGLLPHHDATRGEAKRSEEWKDMIDVMRYTVLYPIVDTESVRDMYSDEDWYEENNYA
jgi:hypothetical protein